MRATILLAMVVGLAACGDDASSDDGAAGTTEAATTSEAATMTGAAPTSETATPPVTTGTGSTSSTEQTSDPTSGPSTGEESTSSGEVDEGTYAALVRGTLFTDDLVMAQEVHDMVAMGGEEAAMMLGDFGHDAKLGTTLLGTTENAFVGLDQWDNLAGAQTLYADPDFAEQFGMLFAGKPNLELFQLRDDWYGWGDPEAGDGGDNWFVVIRGRLAEADVDDAQAMHDPLAMGGEKPAMALGDVAHVVWLGVEDEREFFAIDIWTDDANIEAFYTDPKFMAAFGALFESPPSVGVYRSTDWHQW